MPPTKKSPEPSPALKTTHTALAKMDVGVHLQPNGALPLWDGINWSHVYNEHGIPEGAEHVIDPAKVEPLRRRACRVVDSETVAQLESLGLKVKSLLSTPIKKASHVKAWADSVFNWGPGQPADVSKQIYDLVNLARDDFQVIHPTAYGAVVIPAGPMDSGNKSVQVFFPGLDGTNLKVGQILGPRHEISKAAWNPSTVAQEAVEAPTVAKTARKVSKASTAAPAAPVTPGRRGRPRKDGLPPGSTEAREADERKKRDDAAAKTKAREERQRIKAAAQRKPAPQPKVAKATVVGTAVISPPPRKRVIKRRVP